jgi:hypothetical protein
VPDAGLDRGQSDGCRSGRDDNPSAKPRTVAASLVRILITVANFDTGDEEAVQHVLRHRVCCGRTIEIGSGSVGAAINPVTNDF